MEGNRDLNAPLNDEADRILAELKLAGPQDVYQLTPPEQSPAQTVSVLRSLIEKKLVEERADFLPLKPGDPFAKVYGVARPAMNSRVKIF